MSHPAHSVAEDSVHHREVVEEARRQVQRALGGPDLAFGFIPGGMRIKPDIARTGSVRA